MPEPRNIDERIDAIAQSVELLTIDVHELQIAVKVQLEVAIQQNASIQKLEANATRQAESIARLEVSATRQAESIARLEVSATRQAESIARLEASATRQAESIGSLEATAREDHKSIQTLNLAIAAMTAAESQMIDSLHKLINKTGNHETRIQNLETQ